MEREREKESLLRAAGKPPESSAQTNHKIPTRATKPVRGLTRVPSAHSGCVLLHLRVSVVDTLLLLCVHVLLRVIKGCEQRRPGGRRVMQSAEVKERTQGRQAGRKGGREGGEEGGIVASGDPALQECADGHVLHSRVGLGRRGVHSGKLCGGDTTCFSTSDKITLLQKKKKGG